MEGEGNQSSYEDVRDRSRSRSRSRSSERHHSRRRHHSSRHRHYRSYSPSDYSDYSSERR